MTAFVPPPLPDPFVGIKGDYCHWETFEYFTADQMHAYAEAAAKAER